LGICINAYAGGVGIPANDVSFRYLIIPVPDWVSLSPVPERTGSGNVPFSIPVADLPDTGQSGIPAF
jgi:hypothetical protein